MPSLAFHRAGSLYSTGNFNGSSSLEAVVGLIRSCGTQTYLALPALKAHSSRVSGALPFCVLEPVGPGWSSTLLTPD